MTLLLCPARFYMLKSFSIQDCPSASIRRGSDSIRAFFAASAAAMRLMRSICPLWLSLNGVGLVGVMVSTFLVNALMPAFDNH